ncbi:hypothetical protein GCM10018966_066560 [Streptomyces yanii]
MAANKAVLDAATDAYGQPFQVVEMQHQPHFRQRGLTVETFSYTNYYLTSGSVVVPTAGEPADALALAQFAGLFPGREVVGTRARVLAWGGGGVTASPSTSRRSPAENAPAGVRGDGGSRR